MCFMILNNQTIIIKILYKLWKKDRKLGILMLDVLNQIYYQIKKNCIDIIMVVILQFVL